MSIRMLTCLRLAVLLALCAAAGWPARSLAQTAAEFFGQKTIKFMITYEPGGTYDLYARLVTMHLPKHLSGHPAMTMQYMPGAGGLLGTLHLYDKAPQDGTEIAILPRDIAINQRLRPDTAKYDARRFNWIGTLSSYAGVMFVASRTGVKTRRGSAPHRGHRGLVGHHDGDLHHADAAQRLGRHQIQARHRLSRRARCRSCGRTRRSRRPDVVVDAAQDPARALAFRRHGGDPVPGRHQVASRAWQASR